MSHLWQPIFNSLKSSRIVLTAAHCFKKFDFETSEISDTIDIAQGQGSSWRSRTDRPTKSIDMSAEPRKKEFISMLDSIIERNWNSGQVRFKI